jgi:hypothetical protein
MALHLYSNVMSAIEFPNSSSAVVRAIETGLASVVSISTSEQQPLRIAC